MKKILLIPQIFFLLTISSFAQHYYGWITDVHIGSPKADSDLSNVVRDMNTRNEIEFVIVTGDIGEKGRNEELETAKEILDSLSMPYYIIPGNHDTKWSESGCTKFSELWGDNKFVFEKNNVKYIGLNSGIPWRGGGGHIAAEDLPWLDSVVTNTHKDEQIIFMAHHPLDGDVDNWFEVTNILRKGNIKAVQLGHGHANRLMNFNGIPAAMGRSSLSKGKSWGYNLVEDKPDSLIFFEINDDSIPHRWGALVKNDSDISKIDSAQFINYNNGAELVWKKDLKTTMSASLTISDDKIFAATKDGMIHCFNLEGNELWKYNTHSTIFSRPVRDRDVLAVATIEGDLISLNANNGELLQIIGLGEPLTSQLIAIDIINPEGEKSRGVVVGTANGHLYCYDLYSFEQVWENDAAKGMIETKPLVVDGKIIFGSWDNYLYSVNASNGILNWKWTEHKNFYYSPAACWPVTDGKNIYVSTPDKFVSKIDLLQGTTVWHKNDFGSWESLGISQDKQKLFVKSITDKFYIVSANAGKLIKKLDIDYGLDTMPAEISDWNNNIIFGSKNGKIYLIDSEYNWKPILFTGTARVHTVQHVKDNLFGASNMDGKIFLFTIKQ